MPTPLYRYPAAKTGVIDGALFALVSDGRNGPGGAAARSRPRGEGGKVRWEYACGRFSDREPYVQRNEKEVWSLGPRARPTPSCTTRSTCYRVYPDKVVSLEGKLLARVRATEKVWWGEFLPRRR